MLLDSTVSLSDRAEVFDFLKSSDFYDIRHQEIYKACHELHEARSPIDLVTVTEAVEGKFPNPGTFISSVADEIPATSIEHYTGVIRNHSTTRTAIQILTKRLEEMRALKGESVSMITELLDEIQNEIVQMGTLGNDKFYEPSSLISDAIQEYKALNAGTQDAWIPTGFNFLDDVISVRGSKLIIVAARPGVGKSAFAISAMRNMMRSGHKVALFELEMDRADVVNRWVAQEGNIKMIHLTYGTGPGPETWKGILRAGETIDKWPALVDDEGGLSIHELKRRIRIAKKKGAQVVFIDQLSQIRGEGKTEYERNTCIIQELSKLKKQIRIPIFLLAQINRRSEEKGNAGPALHLLKSTGALEEEADIVLLIDRPYVRNRNPADEDKAIIEIAKNRNGATGKIELKWIGSRAMLMNP
jgi:replicative DNA helicase